MKDKEFVSLERSDGTAILNIVENAIREYNKIHAKNPTCILVSPMFYIMICLECEKFNLTPIRGDDSHTLAKFCNIRIVRTPDLSPNTPFFEVI